jgi:hypothetical protein
MSVPSVNLTLDKGTYFEATFNVTNSDGTVFGLGGYSATAKIRKHPTATSSASFSTSITSSIGEIKITMSSANTALLDAGRNYYDLIITQASTGKVIKIFEGMILVKDTVSL